MVCRAFGKHMTRDLPAMWNLSPAIGNPTIGNYAILCIPAIRTTASVPNHSKRRNTLATLLKEMKRGERTPLDDDQTHTWKTLSQPGCHIPRR
jgi:hypothetical protein